MPSRLHVAKADLNLDASFTQPEFSLFRDTDGLLQSLFARLQQHGLRLQDMKIERGTGSVGEFHVACYLYNFMMAVRVRPEKIEIGCFEVPENYVERLLAAIVDALLAVQSHLPSLIFRAHTMGVALHGTLDGESVKQYLSKFVGNVPSGLGPQIGSGAVFYFGAEDDRLLSSVTVDLSAVLTDGLFVRLYVVWDAKKLQVAAIPSQATGFARHALDCFGLEVPTLRS